MLRQASTIAYYTLLEALRNRLMWLLGLVLVIGIGLSGCLSDLAVTEQKETQVALLAAFLRFTAVFLMVIFVVTSLVREANDKGLELVLALPLPRAGYVLGKLAGFALLAVLPALLFGGLLGLLVQTWDAALWTASLLAELWIVAAFSLLCVMTFQQVMTALSAAMGFYLLARSVTALQQFGQSRYAPDGPLVVNGVSVRLAAGALVGILGPNGSGKTTLLRLLSGTRRPSAGRVMLGDQPLDRLSRRDVARRIAVVPQETELAFEYSAIEIVLMGRHPHLGVFTVEGPEDIRIAREALAATGTTDLADRPFHELSGGEKQRVVIAAALAQSAALLLLDEPAAGLSLSELDRLGALIRDINTHGTTVVIVEHHLELVGEISDAVTVLDRGRVLTTGTPAEVFSHPEVLDAYMGQSAQVPK
jgi:ABC-type cobalamin/Fe3+-siderophores transport system ATPase subunit